MNKNHLVNKQNSFVGIGTINNISLEFLKKRCEMNRTAFCFINS